MTVPQTFPARRSDVESIDSIIAAAYDVISGAAGKGRDWDRERSLFIPGAHLIPTAVEAGLTSLAGTLAPQVLEVEGYIARTRIVREEWVFRKGSGATNRAIWTHRACLEHVRIAS